MGASTDSDGSAGLADRQAAMQQREELLRLKWPDSATVGVMLGSAPSDAEAFARNKRDAGELLGAWAGRDRGYVHPDFQFLYSGALDPRVTELLAALADNPGLSAAHDRSGWQRVFWLYQARGRLSTRALALRRATPGQLLSDPAKFAALDNTARAPAEVFPQDPQTVIDLAREDARTPEPPSQLDRTPS